MITNVKLGKNVFIPHPELVNIYGCSIGDNTRIAAFVEIQQGVKIGRKCKIMPFAFIPTGVVIEDGCFIGPHVCFTNDKYPKAINPNGSLKTSKDWKILKTLVKKRSNIGAGAVILPGITIGENAFIGAGSVVTKNVGKNETVIGNPARILHLKSETLFTP